VKVWIAHRDGLRHLGALPDRVTVEVTARPGDGMPSDPATVELWVPPLPSAGGGPHLLDRFGGLSVVQLLTAGADGWIGRVPDGVTLCTARGVHASSVSEWVLTAILSSLRAFPAFQREQEARRWSPTRNVPTDELAGKRVLLLGTGAIGEATAVRLAPFEVSLTRVGRTARAGVHGVDELPGLLPGADIVVLLVPLTEQTHGLVDADFLAALPDGALLVNAARGPLVRTDALVAELATGRITAALDVTDPEPLPHDHPLWTMPNALVTPHAGGKVRGALRRQYGLVGDQIRRYASGRPLANAVTGTY
jgi:phosphoglycerate dehydrogenase-like enzyme